MSEKIGDGISLQSRGGVPSKERNSNLELYRIITMLLIVAHHYVVNSGFTTLGTGAMRIYPLKPQSIFLALFGGWGKIGINCFVFITGYFMCKSKITVKKFFKLLLEVMFYRIMIGLIFGITGYSSLSVVDFIRLFIPIYSIKDDFTSCFLVFFLFIPFLNLLVNRVSEKMHLRLIVLSLFTYSFFGIFKGTFGFSVTMNYVSWFIVLYFISSYVSLNPKPIFDNTKFWGIAALSSVLASALSIIVFSWIESRTGHYSSSFMVTDSNTILAVITGFTSFMFFKNIKIKQNRFINTVAASTFGVFCIHTNGDAMRQWLWNDTLNNVGMYDSPYLVLHAFGSVIGIFAICTLIDYLRIKLIEKPFFKLWDKYEKTVAMKFNNFESKLLTKLKISND